jgi:hypothetical protein
MRALHRFFTTVTALAISAAMSAGAAGADVPTQAGSAAPPAMPPCRVVDASLATPLDSKSARGGQVFHFTATPADGQPSADGLGVVSFVRGAGRGGKPGQIGVELRYLQQPDGTHLPAMIAPEPHEPSVYHGETRNAPYFLGALGFAKGAGFHVASGVVGVYNFLHSGSQAVVPAGTHLRVVLGDDYLSGSCTIT